MFSSVEKLSILAYLLTTLPLTMSVLTGRNVLPESTNFATLDKSLRTPRPIQQLKEKIKNPYALCAINSSQADEFIDTDNLHSSPGPVPIKYLYKSGHSNAHPELCPLKGAKIRVLILVTSAPANFEIRESIRQTWGRYAVRDDVAIAFVLGKPPSRLKANLTSEDLFYGDLVTGYSIDKYWSLPLKTISLLEWTNTYCPKASFVFKCDDDVFVNIPILLNFVYDPVILDAEKTIFGNIRQGMLTKRDPRKKHYIPEDEYSKEIMPDFLGGPAYMLTRDAVKPLLDGVCDLTFIRIEDVFTTGILARAVGVKILHVAEFNSDRMFLHRPVTDLCKRIATHQVYGEKMFEMWLQIYDDPDGFRQNLAPQPVVCVAPDMYPVPRRPSTRYRLPYPTSYNLL